MIQIKTLAFNPIDTNCYICYTDQNLAMIIDPSMGSEEEQQKLHQFLEEKQLTVKHVVATHAHVDHIVGATDLCERWQVPLTLHAEGMSLLNQAPEYGVNFGFRIERLPSQYTFVNEGDTVVLGTDSFEFLHTPGHAPGSICLVHRDSETVFTGDVLFRGSIGRTDLGGGDLDLLRSHILNKLFTLGDTYSVRPGHGGRTTIERERYHNPFF